MARSTLFSGSSIRRKLVGLVLASLVTTCIVTATLSGWIDARRQSALETDRLTQTARVIGSQAADSVRRGDTTGVFVAIRSISQMPGVTYARIAGADGRLALTFEVVYGHALKPLPRMPMGAESALPLQDMRELLRGGRPR